MPESNSDLTIGVNGKDGSGHAMRACDRIRLPGAIIGKDLGSLAHGTGLIPILLALS
jgi:hypothetical protein